MRQTAQRQGEPAPLLSTIDVARLLGVTPARVRQLDRMLLPQRTVSGVRLYDRRVVERYLEERAARRAAGGQ